MNKTIFYIVLAIICSPLQAQTNNGLIAKFSFDNGSVYDEINFEMGIIHNATSTTN